MRSALAITAGSLAGTLSRLRGGGATALPGVVGLKLDPRLIEHLAADLAGSIIVTGTNGKTTTSRFIGSLLAASGRRYLHNQEGSNLLRGLAASLIAWRGSRHDAWGLFEVDEATMPKACRRLQPKVVIVTNLFRDQLDRYGELKRTADYLKAGLAVLPPDATVILNADDPLVASLGQGLSQEIVYYGLADPSVGQADLPHAADSLTAPDGSLLTYDRVFVGHLGHYHAADFTRPSPTVSARKIKLHGLRGSSVAIHTSRDDLQVDLPLPGLHNVYNAVAATAVGSVLQVAPDQITKALTETAAAFGRVESIPVGDKQVFVGLIKNPTGANELISTLALERSKKHLLVLINDNFADGRDVSWLWDADFERLLPSVDSLTVGGRRAADMALRFKYAGWPIDRLAIGTDLPDALRQALAAVPAGETLYVLPTYTALLELRRILSKQGHLKHYLS